MTTDTNSTAFEFDDHDTHLVTLGHATDFITRIVPDFATLFDRDLTTALVFAAVWRGTVGDALEAEASRARHVSIMGVSDYLGLPYETTRRHMLKLVEMGACRRQGSRQFALEPSTLHAPGFRQLARKNVKLTGRLLRDVAGGA